MDRAELLKQIEERLVWRFGKTEKNQPFMNDVNDILKKVGIESCTLQKNEKALEALDRARLAIGQDHICTASDYIQEAIAALSQPTTGDRDSPISWGGLEAVDMIDAKLKYMMVACGQLAGAKDKSERDRVAADVQSRALAAGWDIEAAMTTVRRELERQDATKTPLGGEVVRTQFNAFPRFVRLLRANSSLTIRGMAEKLGVTPVRVSHLENDHGDAPTDAEIDAYIRVFQLPQPAPLGGDAVTVEKPYPFDFLHAMWRAFDWNRPQGIDEDDHRKDFYRWLESNYPTLQPTSYTNGLPTVEEWATFLQSYWEELERNFTRVEIPSTGSILHMAKAIHALITSKAGQ
jgi:transcriptional regulator with XRE-family HTH domain